MKVGVFGGTFNPVHMGHLIVAEEIRASLTLDTVLFIPAGQPYFKADLRIAEAHHRLAMVSLAVESNPFFQTSDMEMNRPGPTYTVDTLTELNSRLGQRAEMYLLLGLDALAGLAQWHQPQRVLEMSTVVGIPRAGFQNYDPQVLDILCPGASRRLVLLRGPVIEISGSEIRRHVSQGLSIRYQVPEEVKAYIYEHGLYGAKPRGSRTVI